MDLTSSVLAKPGAPVMRQWPPAKRAIRSSSTISFWPMMTFESSSPMRCRLEMICSTSFCSAAAVSNLGACISILRKPRIVTDEHSICGSHWSGAGGTNLQQQFLGVAETRRFLQRLQDVALGGRIAELMQLPRQPVMGARG